MASFCSSCGKSVQPADRFCPACGTSLTNSTPTRVTVTNRYAGKNMQVAGVVILILALLAFFGAVNTDDSSTVILAFVGVVIGGVLFIGGRFSHWYHAE